MKKIVFLSLVALCLPWGLMAQGVVDDLYYVPSKKEKAEQKKNTRETVVVTDADQVVVKSNAPQTVRATAGTTTVVVRDTKGKTMDVDAYNRRYDASDYDFTAQGDTLYIDEQVDDGLDGEWVGGFDGSQDDYEYATRIIRFRNPRYAIPVSSPLYFDVVYGLNTWDWNVYYDGLYAYAFPTFTNRLWWDWRFNSVGWWGYPYHGWGWGWSSWYDPWFYGGWAWHHPHWHHPWHPGPGWGGPSRPWGTYSNRRLYGSRGAAVPGRPASVVNGGNSLRGNSVRRTTTSGTSRRVVGTRTGTSRRNTSAGTRGTGVNSTTRRTGGTYTRPTGTSSVNRTGTVRRTGTSSSTRSYNRGSSTSARRTYDMNTRSNNSSRSRSYSTPSRTNSSRSGISTGGGGSFRSSGGVRGGGGSRSGGGSSRRR